MPTEVSLQELERVYITLSSFREKYEDFFLKLAYILKLARGVYKLKAVCRLIIYEDDNGTETNDCYTELYKDLLRQLQHEHNEAFREFVGFFKRCNGTGYTNICRMMLGENPYEIKKYGKYAVKEGIG